MQNGGGGGHDFFFYRTSATKIISGESSRIGVRSKSPYSAATWNPHRAKRCSTSYRKKYRSGQANTHPLLAAIAMPDGKNHLYIIPLLRAMEPRHSLRDAHLPSVRGYVPPSPASLACARDRACVRDLSGTHPESARPPGARCLRTQSRQSMCLLHLQQVLKWPEGNDQPAGISRRARTVPCLPNEVDAFACFHTQRPAFFYRPLQHALGEIQPG